MHNRTFLGDFFNRIVYEVFRNNLPEKVRTFNGSVAELKYCRGNYITISYDPDRPGVT